ncbi:MAG: biotin carboxylase N-terminal domain-containing protein [Roseicyclus sp.]
MFSKILIANRGEIACRVIETCRRMGVATVAVFSDADRTARHVRLADEAVHVGGAKPAESYLRGAAIIDAAKATGAEAIHPGYGFLSENPDFVEAVEAAGLTFIGPSARAIRAMGLKDAAKALMAKAGVPVVPGYHGENQAPEHLSGAAETIGYPVLIKAVAGGGGKGMRKVDAPADFMDALASARGEAATAFGNDAVLVEKYVEKPRHIEVQVFGDGTRAVHLFERDCSLQRRHQKVIEEAPAPGMTPGMRAEMGAAAVRAAEAIGYAGAGTVEFIADASEGLRPDRFYFMEMNTRLQVEHPVTEAVTGLDLVEWQLRVAAGEPLPMAQEDLALNGHAIEVRLYAEDAGKGFLPATGRIEHLRFGPGARADTGVEAGDEIGPWYDPMIAKLVTHGPTRAVALQRMDRALAGTEVAGTVTNLGFLRRLAGHPRFVSGDVDTGLIAAHLDELLAEPVPDAGTRAIAAVTAMGEGAPAPLQGFTLWAPLRQTIRLGEEDVAVETLGAGRFRVHLGATAVALHRAPDGWRVDGAKRPARAMRLADRVMVFDGAAHGFALPDPLETGGEAGPGGDRIDAPMPGLVKAVFVGPGDTVARGARLAVLEAMKMEHVLTAGRDAVIAEVLAAEGAQVEAGAALILLGPEGESP